MWGLAQDNKHPRQRLDQGVAGYVARNKQLLNVDITQHPWKEIYLEFFPGARSELAVPMLAGGEIRGVLNVESPTPDNFGERDERLLQGLADMAVVVLQNAQAYERERRLVEEGQLLNEISKEITSQLDPAHVFDLILQRALELTHSTLGAFVLYDPDLNDLRTVAARGMAEDQKEVRLSLQHGIVGYAARNKQLLNVDITQPPWKEIYVAFVSGMCSELAVPMLAGDDLRGVLYVESPVPNNFNESDERWLQGLGDLAVVALQNAERYVQANQEARRFRLLYQAGQELGKISELSQLEQAYDIILHIAEENCNGQIVIRRYQDETQELVTIRASYHRYYPPFPLMALDGGINGQVARERRTIVIYDTARLPQDVNPVKLPDPTVRSLVITPIQFKERYYGNLDLSHKEAGYFRDADIQFFEGLTQQLASTIYRLETVQQRREFEQRAISAEVMSSIGQIAFELTHRWGNDLGLVRSYINDIRSELKSLDVTSPFTAEKLKDILQTTDAVLNLNKELKKALVRPSEAFTNEPVVMETRVLLEEAQDAASLPSNIQVYLDIADVSAVRVIHSLVADILRNLMTNAVDAMPEGGTITLRAHNAGRFVALEVIDTGLGIPQQSLSKIFDLFYSTKGSFGFGLWSARTNALRNQGDLTVKSQEGQGTTFTLLLPRTEG
jgi:GAF domain-containing protein